MMTRNYEFAGVQASVTMESCWFDEEDGRLAPFRKKSVEDPCCFRFEKTDSLVPPRGELVCNRPNLLVYMESDCMIRYTGAGMVSWEDAVTCAEYRDKQVSVQLLKKDFPDRVRAKYIINALAAEHLIARNHGVILHCSYIAYEGTAILFTAPSETGKSTQANLWQACRGAEIINGDRAVIRLVDGKLMAEGIPFSGSSQYCENRSLPIAAIVYLAQAPQTSIRNMTGYEAFSRIWEGIVINTWDRTDVENISAVVQKAAAELPVFYLPCTPDETAVSALENALGK